MAEEIGALRALLSATSQAFELDMKRAAKAVNDNANLMQKSFWVAESAGNKLSKQISIIRAAAITMAATGLYVAVQKAIEFASSIKESADKVGLTAEAYQELRYAASQAGVGIEEFDKAMSKMTREVGNALSGVKASQELFAKFGLTLSDLKTLSPDQVMQRLSDKIALLPTAYQRAAAAQAIFGKSGAEMVNFLSEGGAKMAAMREKAQALGLVMSDSLVSRAKEASDQLDTMNKIIQMGFANIALQFLPAMENLAKIISDPQFIGGMKALADVTGTLIEGFQKFGPEIIAVAGALFFLSKGNVPGAIAAFGTLETALRVIPMAGAEMRAGLKADKGAQDESTQSTQQLAKVTKDFGINLSDTNEKLSENTKQLVFQNVGLQQLIERYRDFNGQVATLEADIKLENEAVKQNINLASAGGRAWAAAFREHEQLNRTYADAKKVIDEVRTPSENYAIQIQKLSELLTNGAITQDQYNRAMIEAKDTYHDAQAGLKGLEGAGREMGDAFGNTLEELATGTDTWAASFDKLDKAIANIVLKRTVLKELGDVASDLFDSILGKSKSGGSSDGGIGGFFGDIFGDIFGGGGSSSGGDIVGPGIFDGMGSFGGFLAEGGPARPGLGYIVGEDGPEWFEPNSHGTIIPNDMMGKSGGGEITQHGDTIIVNNHISTGVAGTVRAELAAAMPAMTSAITNAVVDKKRRGGAYAQRFRS